MKPSLLKYIAIFNLLLGVALLLSFVLDKAVSRRMDDFFLKRAMVLKGALASSELKESRVKRIYEGDSAGRKIYWQLTTYAPVKEPSVALVEVGDDPDHIFHENPMSALDYMVAFYNLRYGEDKMVTNVGVTSSFVWPPPIDVSEKNILAEETLNYENFRLGVVLSPSANIQPLPESLKPIVLEPEKIQGGISYLLSVGRVVEYPIIERKGTVTYVPMRIESVDTGMLYQVGNEQRVRLFVRWGNYVLPTLPLMTALDGLGLTLDDVQVEFGKELNLGEGKRILPIDTEGGITVSNKVPAGVIRVSATELVNSNVTQMPLESDKELKAKMAAAQVVLLGEGNTPVTELGVDKEVASLDWDKTLDVNASGALAIMGGLAPEKLVSFVKAGRMGQLIVLLDVLVAATWALTLTKRRRRLVFLALFIAVLLVVGISAIYADLWMPLFPSIIGLILACLLSAYLHRGKRENEEEEVVPEMEEDLIPVPPPITKAKKASKEPVKEKDADEGIPADDAATNAQSGETEAKAPRKKATATRKKTTKAKNGVKNTTKPEASEVKQEAEKVDATLEESTEKSVETPTVESERSEETISGAIIKPPSIKSPSKYPAKKATAKAPRKTAVKKKTPTKRKGKEK